MSIEDIAELEPDPLEIDSRHCGECGLRIDQHRRVDTPEGPEFFCEDDLEIQIHLAAAVFADEYGRTLLLPPPEGQSRESLLDFVPTLASNLWHFPTIHVAGDPVAKLRGHLRILVYKKQNGSLHFVPAGKVRHTVTYRAITVEPFRISVKKLPRIKGAKRVPLHEITVLPVSNLTRKVARAAVAAVSSGAKNR